MSASHTAKTMTLGEAVLGPLFAVAAFLCVFAAAKAVDTAFAFHASIGCRCQPGDGFRDLQLVLRPAGGSTRRGRSTAGPTTIWVRSSSPPSWR